MAMGAFIAGLLIADSPFRHGVIAEIQPFRGLLLGLFFMSMGMSLNLGEFFAQPLTVLGMLVTPPLAYLARRLTAAGADRQRASDEVPARAPVVLTGFGRVGRRIGQILTLAGEPYVAIDRDSSLVLRERANGHRIFYGDARRPEVLRAVGVSDADLVIVTVDDFEATENIVAALHQAYPDVTILARGRDADHCRTLRKLGARIAVSETLEASLEPAREALIRDDSDTARVEALLRRFHQEHYKNLDAANTQEASDREPGRD